MSRAEPIVRTPSWWSRAHPGEEDFLVAYFCMEFGVDETLPIYSGGLGVLAGDHLKSASDLGIPLVGLGLLYRDGYFRQRLDRDGRQSESPQPIDPEALGLTRETTVSVELGDDTVEAAVWRYDVGRVPLYLLDAPGLEPTVWHMNEGHCAFLTCERLRRDDLERVRATTIFTKHTPVPAGN